MPVSLSSLYAPTAAAIVTAGTAAGWGSNQPQWALITSSTSNANSYTFNSISGYRYLRIVIKDYTCSQNPNLQFNGSSTGYSSDQHAILPGEGPRTNQDVNSDKIYLNHMTPQSTTHSGGTIDIFDVNTSLPMKRVESRLLMYTSYSNTLAVQNAVGFWKNTNPITSVVFNANITFNAGSHGIFLYGAN